LWADGKLKGEGGCGGHRHGGAGHAALVEVGDGDQPADERVDPEKGAVAADLVAQESDGDEGPGQSKEKGFGHADSGWLFRRCRSDEIFADPGAAPAVSLSVRHIQG